ncbi:hypothetical protein [Ruegeria hyattellae]|uniref:hypothetical protein n=1 Tax=Ruegeria hyattellae TaxID=3233337 RepID=UPI00355C4429
MRFVLTFISVFLFSTQLHAKSPDYVSREDLRGLVYAREFSAVESALEAAQSGLESGVITEDDVRTLYGIFAVTHPKVISFTEDWLDARPQSPYAQIARTWVLFRAGWIVRGDRYANETHPDALQTHYDLHGKALNLARAAYEQNEMLVAASDAIILLSNTGGDKDYSFQVFEETMSQMPNWGTLTRAFSFGHPGYGGSYQIGEMLCDHFAPMVDLDGKDAARYCKIQLLVEQRNFQDWPYMALTLMEDLGEDPSLDRYRFLAQLNNHPMTPAQADAVRDHVEEHGLSSLYWAEYYDRSVARLHNFEPQTEKVLAEEKERARAALENDPYNPHLLDTLIRQSHTVTLMEIPYGDEIIEQAMITPIKDSPSPEDRLAYLQRKVAIAPYDPKNWTKLADELKNQSAAVENAGADLLRWDGYTQNAIYFGLHRMEYLENYARNKLEQYAQLFEIRGLAREFSGWDKALREIDENSDLICPIVRVGLLLEFAQEHGDRASQLAPKFQAVIDVLTEDVAQNSACPGLLDADLEDLVFDFVPLDVLGQQSPFAEGPYWGNP